MIKSFIKASLRISYHYTIFADQNQQNVEKISCEGKISLKAETGSFADFFLRADASSLSRRKR